MQERAFFDWQFRDTPNRLAEGEYDFLVLRNDQTRIVGCLGFVGFEFRIEDRIEIGGWTHNWYAPELGDGGLALLGAFMKFVPNRFLLRLNDNSGQVVKLLRIPFLPTIPRLWAVLDEDRASDLFGMSDNADRLVLHRSAKCFRRNAAAPIARRVLRLEPEQEFLLGHLGKTTGYARRTGRYLNWRYVEIPKHDYRIIRTDQAVGVYRVEKIMGTDVSVIRMLEWTFGATETAGAITTVLAETTPFRPVLIDFHCTLKILGSFLEPFGFMPQSATKTPMPDLFRPTHRSGGYAVAIDLPPHRTFREVDFDSWYITIGDSDIDRVKR
jgi:hypothetical protein